jgi:hypothetical protein
MPTTDQTLFSAIQRKLNEPPDGGQSFFTQRWTHDELVRTAADRQDALLKATHLQIGMAASGQIVGVLDETAGDPLVGLPDDWIATVALIRFPAGARPYLVDLADSWSADYGDRTMVAAAGVPKVCLDAETPSRTLRLIPAPAVAAPLLLYYVPRAAVLTGTGEYCTVPDELAWSVLQYGILADLLGKTGRAQDLPRANYCRGRYQLGVEVTEILLRGLP